ncbi:MAG TPA: AAA family ATPase [Thermoplasmata archaeon]|nr:AAA family ATPase [Thermoplasmata archaeon]
MTPASRSRGAIVALEGASGSGKTTASTLVAQRLGGWVVAEAWQRLGRAPSLSFRSPSELLRLETDLLVEEGRRYQEARRLADRGRLVVADTGFLGPMAYTSGLVARKFAPARVLPPLLRTVRAWASDGRWGMPDLTVYLVTDARTRRRRVSGDPRGHPAELAERHEAVGRWERSWFLRRLAPVLGSRFRLATGVGTPLEVARGVARVMHGIPGNSGTPEIALEVVQTLADSVPQQWERDRGVRWMRRF